MGTNWREGSWPEPAEIRMTGSVTLEPDTGNAGVGEEIFWLYILIRTAKPYGNFYMIGEWTMTKRTNLNRLVECAILLAAAAVPSFIK